MASDIYEKKVKILEPDADVNLQNILKSIYSSFPVDGWH